MGILTNSGKLIEKIESKQDELTAGEGIKIKNGPDYSAMQGPAPDGFHIPSKDEWEAILPILFTTFSLPSREGTLRDYLKMTPAGYRWMGGSVSGQGSYYYWTSTASDTYTAFCLAGYSGMVNISDIARSNATSIRCFKNTPVVPDNSWTTLYDGSSVAAGAGIFHNTADGLISISGDGVTWYTIQDKNLGATEVFNGGTVTDANSGYFYQWGNNYGFAHSGDVTTSSTQVDASNYGPGNYYNSSTFITRRYEDESYDWSSTLNNNLWGGVTGVVTLDNAITNTGVLSVNGQTGDVTVASPDMSNYLAKDNTTAFTPIGDYNPATKKYVDDGLSGKANASDIKNKVFLLPRQNDNISDIITLLNNGGSVTFYEPYSELATVVGYRYYTVVDYEQQSNVIKAEGEATTVSITLTYGTTTVASVTTEGGKAKKFSLSSTSDMSTAEKIVEWYNLGGVPVILYNSHLYTFQLYEYSSQTGKSYYTFYADVNSSDGASTSSLNNRKIMIEYNPNRAFPYSISDLNSPFATVLKTGIDYSTPYTPEYAGSPATKKYVDDAITSSGGGSSGVTTNLLLQGSVHKGTLSNPNCSGDSLCSYTFQGSGTVSNISYCTICGHHDLVINSCNLGCLSNYQGYTINAKSGDVVGLCYVHGSHYNSCNKASLCYVDIY